MAPHQRKITALSIIRDAVQVFYQNIGFFLMLGIPYALLSAGYELLYNSEILDPEWRELLLPIALSAPVLLYSFLYMPKKLVERFLPEIYTQQSLGRCFRRVGAWFLKILGCGAVIFFIFHWLSYDFNTLSLIAPDGFGEDLLEQGVGYFKNWHQIQLQWGIVFEVFLAMASGVFLLRVIFGNFLAFTSKPSTLKYAWSITKEHAVLLGKLYLLTVVLFAAAGMVGYLIHNTLLHIDNRIALALIKSSFGAIAELLMSAMLLIFYRRCILKTEIILRNGK